MGGVGGVRGNGRENVQSRFESIFCFCLSVRLPSFTVVSAFFHGVFLSVSFFLFPFNFFSLRELREHCGQNGRNDAIAPLFLFVSRVDFLMATATTPR